MSDTTLYSHIAIALVVLIAAFGLPLPVAGMLTAAGVLAAHGEMNIGLLIVLSAAGAILGDALGYVAGRLGVRWLARRATARDARVAASMRWLKMTLDRVFDWKFVRQATGWSDAMLDRRGSMGLLILLSRTVLTAFGPVVNIVSGARRYSLGRFLLYDAVGEIVWAGTYVGFGYLAGEQGQDAMSVLTNPYVIAGMIALTVIPMLVTARIKPQPQPVSIKMQ
ncbi:MAG: VTT domain-containing protein [Thermomicrobia bacterium]|nr:VTT domain-containing protein [Thermomicrobia bacterium]MCA1722940.1 VTT domain-containing protein [Thermomicrobia bacterium]